MGAKPLPHHYEVRLHGRAEGYATLSVAGMPDLGSAPPAGRGCARASPLSPCLRSLD